jgi:hypothetical protein
MKTAIKGASSITEKTRFTQDPPCLADTYCKSVLLYDKKNGKTNNKTVQYSVDYRPEKATVQ